MSDHQRGDGSRVAVLEEARSWLRTPYHHAARVKGAGVDCGQLLALVYEAAGVVGPVVIPEYPRDWHLHNDGEVFLGILEQFARPASYDVPRPGDVLLFRFGRCLSHSAIVTEWPAIIHAQAGVGVLEDSLDSNVNLRARLAGAWTCWGDA